MADEHEQPESSTAYSGPLRINIDELRDNVFTFIADEEEAQNSRKKAFTDEIQEKARREGKNEQEIQAHLQAAEHCIMLYRAGRTNCLRIEYEMKRVKEKTKKRKIEEREIEERKEERSKKRKIEKDKIEKDKIKKHETEKDKVEKDRMEKEKE
ncbi:uncharacterized protein Triagg1_8877 [Trichoderma aggressivum f. europaeum]|uniref:Uncharacterized protein n=1 Tax=Trichoderma aggressivum f. europaeum TaxID=173218 RepID=A0AAE1I7D8_9HYPO|nr:hypothetical protein Triagg1_8877 [Trichoderma aggressivum f. europaeum]